MSCVSGESIVQLGGPIRCVEVPSRQHGQRADSGQSDCHILSLLGFSVSLSAFLKEPLSSAGAVSTRCHGLSGAAAR